MLFSRNPGTGGKVAPTALREWLNQGRAIVLDVRGPDEFSRGHISGAILVPLEKLRDSLDTLPKDRPIVAVCLRGRRSAKAARMLCKAGFAEVYNLSGGMLAWPYEVEQGI